MRAHRVAPRRDRAALLQGNAGERTDPRVHLQAERILITRRDAADRMAHVAAATPPQLLWPGSA